MSDQKNKEACKQMDISKSISERLTFLLNTSVKCDGKTQKAIADEIGVSSSVLTKIKSGESKDPSATTIASIAKYFNVSTDYLLGLTNVTSTDKDIIGVCKYIGINDKHIKMLKSFVKKYGAWRTEKLLEGLLGAIEETMNG